MTLLQAAVLGAVQGVTEFLPVSSSGHLFLARWLMGWPDPGLTFDIALHVGTLAAVYFYFRGLWVGMLFENRKFLYKILLATVPALFAGAALKHHAETVFRSAQLVAVNLIVVGVLMELADRRGKRTLGLGDLDRKQALTVGLAQACAVVPGVSRSGSTIAAALALGFTRESAARLSFLMSTPITLAAIFKGAFDLRESPAGITLEMILPMAVGALVAAVVGYAAVSGLVSFLTRRSLRVFVVYRILFGFLVLWLARSGRI